MTKFKIKKMYILFLALALTSCTNISSQKVFDKVGGIFNNKDTGELVEIKKDSVKVEENEKKDETEDKVLKSENVEFYLNIVKNRLKTNQKIEKNNEKSNYKVLVGEYLILNTDIGNKVKVVSSPKNASPRVKMNNNKIYFRSIYRGNYGINLYQDNSLVKKIDVAVTSKNNFSESNIYDIIVENSMKNNKILKDAVTLYKIYYPNGKNYKKVSYELLKYGYKNNDKAIMNEALKVLKSDIGSFSDEEKILLLEVARLNKKRIFIPESIYTSSDKKLQNVLAEYIKTKDILDKKDKVFLEKNFPNILDKVSDEKEKVKDEEMTNSFFGKFQEKINIKKEKNIKEYKKALSQEKSKDKKAEIYYNLMSEAVKSGNKVKALRYFSLIKQQSANSEWTKKAENLVNKIK